MGPEAGLPELAIDRIISDLLAGGISSLEQEEISIDDLLDISISRGIPVQDLVDMMPPGVRSKVEASQGRGTSRLDTTDDARARRGFGRSAYLSGLVEPVAKTAQTKGPREEQSAEFRRNVYGSVKNLASNFYEGALSDVAGFSQQGVGIGLDVLGGAASLFGMDKISASLERQSDRLYNQAVSNIRQGVSATAGMNPNDFDLEPEQFSVLIDAAKATEDARKEAGVPTLSPEETVMAQPLVPKNLDQATIDKALATIQNDPNINLTPEPEVGETDIDAGEADVGGGDVDTGGGDVDTGGGAGRTNRQGTRTTSKRDLRSRYNEKLELFKEIYGTEDKDEAQDRAMSLAMIGLAIAAGQSPNALTNIAQGLSVGLQGMGAQREAARDRERGVRTLALETAIDQQAAEAGAEADAAKTALEQANKLELEEFKARIGAMYGGAGGSRDARNIIDFTQNTYTEALKAASAMTAPDFDPDTETPHQYAMRQAQQASESMGRMFPGYGGLTSPDAPAAPETPTITTREEYDALPSGTKFMQNGQERIKP